MASFRERVSRESLGASKPAARRELRSLREKYNKELGGCGKDGLVDSVSWRPLTLWVNKALTLIRSKLYSNTGERTCSSDERERDLLVFSACSIFRPGHNYD